MTRSPSEQLLVELLSAGPEQPLGAMLRALLEESSEAGSRRALASLGLEDERARRDMDELRELLGTWRDVKRSAWQTAARWVARVLLALLMVAIAYRLDLLRLIAR